MKVVSRAQMYALDRRTIEEYGLPGEQLMDRAGFEIAQQVLRLAWVSGRTSALIELVAGKGNNGGDAFAAARYLKAAGARVVLYLAGSVDQLQGDARTHWDRMNLAQVPVEIRSRREDWRVAPGAPASAGLVVDGLLGIGASGAPRGVVAEAIAYIRHAATRSLVLAIDIPSGLDADSGQAAGAVVSADVTLTMGLPKRGLLAPEAIEHVGHLKVAQIGFPPEYIAAIESEEDCEVIDPSELRALVPRRKRTGHKGDYGHVLLVGGSRDYSGAIILAARAALRGGAGLVTVLVPERIGDRVAAAAPELMVRTAPETETGSLAIDCWTTWRERHGAYSALLVGPGMTRDEATAALVRMMVRDVTVPMVLDADALNAMANDTARLRSASARLVLTPHPGEFASLVGRTVPVVQADRCGAALQAAADTGAVVVLKGAHTVVAREGDAPHINVTGNPGMATGGSGDVLAGLLTAWLGQGLSPFDAARLAVYLHGQAGDQAAWQKTETALIASDLIERLPGALRTLC